MVRKLFFSLSTITMRLVVIVAALIALVAANPADVQGATRLSPPKFTMMD
jgi:hypothetical protein